MKIALISSASDQVSFESEKLVEQIIQKIKLIPNIQLFTGGSLGIPGIAIQKAYQENIQTVAYSPDKNGQAHNERFDNLKTEYFHEIKFIPGFTARSLRMIHDADAVLLMNGRIGTLSEFTIALEEGKRVGIITNTGGIADHLEYILSVAQKEFPGQVFFSDNCSEVIDWLVQ